MLSELFKESLATSGVSLRNGPDDFTRSHLKWANTRSANLLSGVTAYGLAPALGLGGLHWAGHSYGEGKDRAVDALIMTEAVLVASSFNQLVKFWVKRERPLVRDLTPADRSALDDPGDENLSFYSGHTSFAFAIATSATTVAWMRGYSGAPWILAGGLAIAGTTGYLRIAADKHYLSDVLVGAVVGSAFGFAIPYLFHKPSDSAGEARASMTVSPGVGTQLVQFSWNW